MEEVDDTMYDIIEEDHVIEESMDDYGYIEQTDEAYEMEEEHLEEIEVEDEKPYILNSQLQHTQIVKGHPGQVLIMQNPSSSSHAYPVKLIASNVSGTTQIISPPRQPPPTSVQIVRKTIQAPSYKTIQQQPRVITQYVQQQPQAKYIVKSSGQQVILTSPTSSIKQEPGTSTTITREIVSKNSGLTITKRPAATSISSQRIIQSGGITMRQIPRQHGTTTIVRQQPTILNRSLGTKGISQIGQTRVIPKQTYKVASPASTSTSSIQAVNVPGKGIQYMRILNSQAKTPMRIPSPSTRVVTPKAGYTVVSSGGGGGSIKREPGTTTQIIQRRVVPQQQQKMIAVVKKERDPLRQAAPVERPSKTTVLTTSQLSQIKGVNIIPGNNSKTKIVMLPADYMTQLRELQRKQHDKRIVQKSTINQTIRRLKDSMDGGRKKRQCNCTKSQCLKLYCDCFAAGEFCDGCNCKDCQNNQENEEDRQKAIRSCLERNPMAFKPKIKEEESFRLHKKGCNCKRSGCLKNYCECYEAKVTCSGQCKCIGCHNFDPAMAEEKEQAERELQFEKERMQAANKRSGSDPAAGLGAPGAKQPYNFMTPDVIEATVQCMLAQAEECQKRDMMPSLAEKLILEEFGRCLVEIINFSIKNDG